MWQSAHNQIINPRISDTRCAASVTGRQHAFDLNREAIDWLSKSCLPIGDRTAQAAGAMNFS
jgi:hypothetical protein